MTNQKGHEETRDEVLLAFQEACELPTAEQILEWTKRYPEFAEDIRAHAAIARDWAAREGVPVTEPDATMLARGHSRVLNAIHDAQVAAAAKEPAEPCLTFKQLTVARGTDVPRLARDLDIKRSVLADLFNGGMLQPAGPRLVKALSTALGVLPEAVIAAHQQALNAPRVGHAKADGTPTIKPRTYEEVIRTSGMAPERIEHWLSEDE